MTTSFGRDNLQAKKLENSAFCRAECGTGLGGEVQGSPLVLLSRVGLRRYRLGLNYGSIIESNKVMDARELIHEESISLYCMFKSSCVSIVESSRDYKDCTAKRHPQ
jgi:hypothetical protein